MLYFQSSQLSREPLLLTLSLFSSSSLREIIPTFSTTFPWAWTLGALSASERAIVEHSDTIPPGRAFSGAAAADRHGTPGGSRSRSSRIATQSSPWVDRRGGSSSSAFWLCRAAVRPAGRSPPIEDSSRDAGRAAAASSAAPDESSPPGSCTPPTPPNSPTREIGSPKTRGESERQVHREFDEVYT